MTDYQRGVEQASAVYQEIIREYVTENAKLRKLVRGWRDLAVGGADSLIDWNHKQADLEQRMRELGIEADA